MKQLHQLLDAAALTRGCAASVSEACATGPSASPKNDRPLESGVRRRGAASRPLVVGVIVVAIALLAIFSWNPHKKAMRLVSEGKILLLDHKPESALSKALAALELEASGKSDAVFQEASDLAKQAEEKIGAAKNLAKEGKDLRARAELAAAERKAIDALEIDLELQDAKDLESQIAEDRAQIATLLKEGRAAFDNEDYDLALEKANAALELDCENAEAKKLRLDVREKVAIIAIALSLVEKGEGLFASGLLDDAEACANEALAEYPKCQEATKLLPRIAEAREKATARLKECRKAFDDGNYDLTKDIANAVLALDSENAEAKKLLSDAQAEIARRLANEAKELRSKGELRDAEAKVREALLNDPYREDANELQRLITKDWEKVKTLLEEGRRAFDDKNYVLAKDKTSAVLRIDKRNKEAEELYSEAKIANAKRLAAEGEGLRRSGELSEADAKAKEALSEDQNCRAAKDLQSQIAEARTEIATLLQAGRKAFDGGNYPLAEEKASAALNSSMMRSCSSMICSARRFAVSSSARSGMSAAGVPSSGE